MNMNEFAKIVDKKLPGMKRLPADSPPFHLFDVSKFLEKTKMTSQALQQYCLDNGLALLVGGFGTKSDHFMRISFTGMTDEESVEFGKRLVELINKKMCECKD
jgi:DNA-binding transcriptional MocR family regulator